MGTKGRTFRRCIWNPLGPLKARPVDLPGIDIAAMLMLPPLAGLVFRVRLPRDSGQSNIPVGGHFISLPADS